MLGEESMYPMDWLVVAERDLHWVSRGLETMTLELPDFFYSKPWKSP